MFIQTGNDKKGFWLNWDLKSLKPDMVSMVDFTDATNPLFIRKGNPNLKNALKFSVDINYKFSFGNQSRNQLRFCADFDLTDNALSYGYTYDSTTGIRTGSYHNVKGNLGGNGEIIYRFNANGFRIYNKLQGGRRTCVDLVGYDSPVLTRSKVYDLNFSDEMYFTYTFGRNEVSANFSGTNNRYSSNLADFTNQNTWTFRTGVSLLYNLPANFQISTDFTVFNRRGYTDAALNSDNFIWNECTGAHRNHAHRAAPLLHVPPPVALQPHSQKEKTLKSLPILIARPTVLSAHARKNKITLNPA